MGKSTINGRWDDVPIPGAGGQKFDVDQSQSLWGLICCVKSPITYPLGRLT